MIMPKSGIIFFAAIICVLITACLPAESKEAAGPGIEDNEKGELNMKEIAVIQTTKGDIEVQLESELAPVTVANFKKYVNESFYDGTIFHRVIPSFMIQGGGFKADGRQKTTHDPIALESRNGLKNAEGAIAMARTAVPDSATSQFFINTANNDFLNYAPGNDGYAVFGKVVSGLDVVRAIEKVQTATRGGYENWPVEDVIITRIYMKK